MFRSVYTSLSIFIFALALIFTSGIATAEPHLVVLCEKGKWQGQRVGFGINGEEENDSNSINFDQYLIVIPTPVEAGGNAFIRYGGKSNGNEYTGSIRYKYGGSSSAYAIIETTPKELLEVITIEFPSFNVIYQTTKSLGGIFVDVFTKKCTGNLIDPDKNK